MRYFVSFVSIVGILVVVSCEPTVKVENYLAHPVIIPPPSRNISFALWFQMSDLSTREGENVKIIHDGNGLDFTFSRQPLGLNFAASERYIYPGLFLWKRFGNFGAMLRGNLTYNVNHVKAPLLLDFCIFERDSGGQIFFGGRKGDVLNYVFLKYDLGANRRDSVRNWLTSGFYEGYIGFEGFIRKKIGLFASFSFGRYKNGIYSYDFDNDSIPHLKPISEPFTQIQLGFNGKF